MSKYKPLRQRLLFIDEQIRRGRYPNCRQLAKDWEVSSKTIQRDIDFLRDIEGAPIEYDRIRHGFYYREPNFSLPAINIKESDLFAICIAERALEQYKNTPLYAKLAKVFEKIEDSLPDKVTLHPEWVDRRISFIQPPPRNIVAKIWETIAKALSQSRRLLIGYRSPSAQSDTLRRLDPYHMLNYRGEWYVIGHCHKNGEVRMFAVSRIKRAEILDSVFEVPADFDPQKMLGHRFGIMVGAQVWSAEILFDAKAAPYVRERTWQDRQTLEDKPGGRLLLRVETSNLEEVAAWVLSWGCRARALNPPELVAMLQETLAKTMALYAAAGKTHGPEDKG